MPASKVINIYYMGFAAKTQNLMNTVDAGEAPGRVGDGLDQIGFALADGLELVLVSADVALVFGGIVGWEKNGAAGQSGFHGIQRCAGFAFVRLGTSGELGCAGIKLP